MEKAPKKGNLVERGAELFRNIHLAIGAVALAATPFVGPAYEAFAATVGIFEFAHAAILEGLRRVAGSRKNTNAAPAPA